MTREVTPLKEMEKMELEYGRAMAGGPNAEQWLKNRSFRDLREASATERRSEATLYGLCTGGIRMKGLC